MKKIKFAKVAPEVDHTSINSLPNQSKECPADLFLAKMGYELTKLSFLTTVPPGPFKTHLSPQQIPSPDPSLETDRLSKRHEAWSDKRSGDKAKLCAGDHNASCTTAREKLTSYSETIKTEDIRKSSVFKNVKYRFGHGHRIQRV